MNILLKRTLSFAISVIFAVCLCVTAFGEPDAKDGIDALLLIDLSGSMRSSDSSRNAIEATKMFIDMLETKNSRVGIIGFNDTLTGVVDITEINTTEDKNKLKEVVDGFKYDGYTDIGMPLKEAVGIMSRNMRASNSPMVLLLTDGNIDLSPDKPRKPEDSYEDIVSAVGTTGKNLPIYTIGLNYDGSVDRQLLKTISENTSGRSYIISQATDLPQIFNEIFADHIKSSLIEISSFIADGESYTDVNFEIENDFVAVANIIMLSEHEIVDAKLVSPEGKYVSFDQSSVVFSSSKKYSIIKVAFPAQGAWTLKAKGVKGDQVKVNLIYLYDVSIETEIEQPEAIGTLFNSTLPITINGYIMVNGEKAVEDDIYRNTASSAIVNDSDGNLIAKIPLVATPEGLSGQFTPSSDDPVTIYIEMVASKFTKQSPKTVIQFEPVAVVTESTPAATTPAPPPDTSGAKNIFLIYVAVAAVIVMLLALSVVFFQRRKKPRFFDGFIEVRAMNEEGVYSSLETPALHTYVGTIDLKTFLLDNTPAKMKRAVSELPFNLSGVALKPSLSGIQSAVELENKSGSLILNDDETPVSNKKIIWKPDERLIIKGNSEDSVAKLELTYRLEEM